MTVTEETKKAALKFDLSNEMSELYELAEQGWRKAFVNYKTALPIGQEGRQKYHDVMQAMDDIRDIITQGYSVRLRQAGL
jgi:hypothetical protein